MGVGAVKAKVKHSKSTEKEISESTENNEIENSENTSMSAVVSSKLRKMYPDQREFAESLINQVLTKGFSGQLSAHSQVRTPNFNDKSPMFLKSTSKISAESSPSSLNLNSNKTEFVSCPNSVTNRNFDLTEFTRDSSNSGSRL